MQITNYEHSKNTGTAALASTYSALSKIWNEKEISIFVSYKLALYLLSFEINFFATFISKFEYAQYIKLKHLLQE